MESTTYRTHIEKQVSVLCEKNNKSILFTPIIFSLICLCPRSAHLLVHVTMEAGLEVLFRHQGCHKMGDITSSGELWIMWHVLYSYNRMLGIWRYLTYCWCIYLPGYDFKWVFPLYSRGDMLGNDDIKSTLYPGWLLARISSMVENISSCIRVITSHRTKMCILYYIVFRLLF